MRPTLAIAVALMRSRRSLRLFHSRNRRSAAVVLLGLGLLGSGCLPAPPYPTLLASDPVPGAADVAPTVWPVLTFASPVAPRLGPTLIECGESRPRVKATALSDTQVVLNPAGELPPDTDCELRFSTVDGPQLVAFRTAAAGPPVST